jgi:hypothetical protein
VFFAPLRDAIRVEALGLAKSVTTVPGAFGPDRASSARASRTWVMHCLG